MRARLHDCRRAATSSRRHGAIGNLVRGEQLARAFERDAALLAQRGSVAAVDRRCRCRVEPCIARAAARTCVGKVDRRPRHGVSQRGCQREVLRAAGPIQQRDVPAAGAQWNRARLLHDHAFVAAWAEAPVVRVVEKQVGVRRRAFVRGGIGERRAVAQHEIDIVAARIVELDLQLFIVGADIDVVRRRKAPPGIRKLTGCPLCRPIVGAAVAAAANVAAMAIATRRAIIAAVPAGCDRRHRADADSELHGI